MAETNQDVDFIRGPITRTCSEAITPSGCVLQVDADGKVSISDANDDPHIGVAAHTTSAADERITVNPLQGFQYLRAGGAINEGDWLTVETGGRVIPSTTDTHELVGRAVEAAADGDLFLVACGISRYAG